jgi:hypothetical protein
MENSAITNTDTAVARAVFVIMKPPRWGSFKLCEKSRVKGLLRTYRDRSNYSPPPEEEGTRPQENIAEGIL